MAKFLNNTGLNDILSKITTWATGKFVAKEAGKGLSTNDFTTAEKNKLNGIESGAQVNKLECIQLNGVDVTVANKKSNIDLSNYATKADISSVYKYKGTKPNYAALPTSGMAVGDTYNVEAADSAHDIKAGDNVAWDGTKWDSLSGIVDISGLATKTELNTKVDKVTGKGLSANDYTTAEKNKLAGLSNYTHPTNDGSKHVPANGTSNAGKVLTAGAAAGTYTWEPIPATEAITAQEIETMWSDIIG